MTNQLKTTPLNQWHKNNKANMADFGGYDMPLWYSTGVKNEHLGVLKSAGIFDTSHMACIGVMGQDACKVLQCCFTKDLTDLKDGRCTYGAFLNPEGHVIDDAIVYRFSPTYYMVCVNAGMGGIIAKHLVDNRKGLLTDIEDLSGKLGKIDIQGINAAKILFPLINKADSVFQDMTYFSFKGHFDEALESPSPVVFKDGTSVLLSRSGYTGEFGFEIFLPADRLESIWKKILEAGSAFDVVPCGLGARDSLRTGAVLPLSHQDIGTWKFIRHPWMFALPFTKDGTGFTKTFIGDAALLDAGGARYTYPFVGTNLRKVGTGDASRVMDSKGNPIGRVLSCATDMAIDWHEGAIVSIASPDLPEQYTPKGLSCGFVLVDKELPFGEELILQEKKRTIHVKVVKEVRPNRTAKMKIDRFL